MTAFNDVQTLKLRTVALTACFDRLSMTALNDVQASKLRTVSA
jgi:hypothetical protein